jgi:hypothetical protein
MIPGMHPVTRFGTVLLGCATLAACGKGGEGESCNSNGPVGPQYCDPGLICNGAAGSTCERPMSRHDNEPCDVNDLCATGLWCDPVQKKCRPTLSEGDPCTTPFSCGPDLSCTRDLATLTMVCGPKVAVPDGGTTTGASVVGILTLPGDPRDAKFFVKVLGAVAEAATPVAETMGTTTRSTSVVYEVRGVPAGTYFVLGFVDVDSSGGTASTPGDFAGWYGHSGDGNPPAAPNVVVPESGSVRFDFSLVVR